MTITFDPPAAFEKAKTFPAPTCWTERALPEAVLPTTNTLLELMSVGTDGLKLIVFY
jgi:hypothetical protein